MNPIESYIRDLRDIRSSGHAVKEVSYYGALERLLNEIGRTLRPKVRCFMQLKNRGAGLPDGGLFTPDQLQKGSAAEPLAGQIPSRGVIEIKGTREDVRAVADGEQVSRYWGKYRQVLVTNYRDFVLVGRDAEGKASKLETYGLAESESDFWLAAAHPRALADRHGERLVEFLKRVMLHAATLAAPEDVAWFLASYARDARARIEGGDLPALTAIRSALEEALGISFEGQKGDHFFRSTLVQTLFYGMFSAWVLWSKRRSPSDRRARFDWGTAARELRIPILRKLFHEVAEPGQLEAMDLSEVLNWAGDALNRVDRTLFFQKFEEGHAVQYFYEPFLQAYDPVLRKDLGVWYTPSEIVQYMVARVDTVLREELKIRDGLADRRVFVLDPCCGTGAYLVEVIKRIHATLREKGGDALTGDDLKRAAMERIFGFEILPAPFVIAHMQLGLLLQSLGAPVSDKKKERVGVYLTNALSGWEPPTGAKQQLTFPELEAERDAADHVKQQVPILVVLGNPPYNAFSGVSPKEEGGLVEPYKDALISKWGIKKFNLDDLYVRFFRLAERRIAEMTGRGVICYISNFSYLGDPSFVVMRQRFLDGFDKLWFDCLNGDSRETGKVTPDGKPDPSVFSTEQSREGIQVGTCVGLLVRRAKQSTTPEVSFRNFWGVNKRSDLLDSIRLTDLQKEYQAVMPQESNRFSFRPSEISGDYLEWPKLVDLSAVPPMNGLMEKRGGALIDIDRSALERRMRMYYDPAISWDELRALRTGLTEDAARFDARKARKKVLAAQSYKPSNLQRYVLRPFDTRWCYYSGIRPLWNEPRPTLWAQCWRGNAFLLSRVGAAKDPEGPPFYFVTGLSDDHLLAPDASCFPLRIRRAGEEEGEPTQGKLLRSPASGRGEPGANHSVATRAYLDSLGVTDEDGTADTADIVWMHALAVGYSPPYLTENADGIRQDWPRVPMPDSKDRLLTSAKLGRQVAALLDTENEVDGVTCGRIRSELQEIAVLARVGGRQLNKDAGELDVTAGWGHRGKGGVTMPGKGRLAEREYSPEETAAIRKGSADLRHLGERTWDVFLNDVAYWKNIPLNVWQYTIGGYQVMKKWLSYREYDFLGRSLTSDEAREVTNMARRIAGILLLTPLFEENYRVTKESSYPWPGSAKGA